MNDYTLNLSSLRARKARLAKRLTKRFYPIYMGGAVLWTIVALLLYFSSNRKSFHQAAFFVGFVAVAWFMLAMWDKYDLKALPPSNQSLEGRLSGEVLGRLKPGQVLTPQSLWQSISNHWQVRFLLNHLFLPRDLIYQSLSSNEADTKAAWQTASQYAEQFGSQTIEPGFIAAGLLNTSPAINNALTRMKLEPSDISEVTGWLGRGLKSMQHHQEAFGGIGRDWAFGFTPLLDRLGENISLAIAKQGAHFSFLTASNGVGSIESSFNNHAGAVALIGPEGIGKTSHVFALAQKLIEGHTSSVLAYHQVVGLNASDIIAAARGAGELEALINHIFAEAAKAGHILLFLDDAQLFFQTGPGSFDATNILLPIVQNRAVPLIMAMTPEDFQRLRTSSASFANLMTPVILQEPSAEDVLHVLEDTAINFEARYKVLITLSALRQAYYLSGRYDQDSAYPGKAIKLLEQAVSHADQGIVTNSSVEQAIEQTHGVKVGTAAAPEADVLLHLEDKIHQRMINQTHAVQVVAAALRRSRAGVADPRRPIGSFLFLGPTGVGKTELAKSVAAEYFGNETNMVRLDMSEYQQAEDAERLLATGQHETSSLLMSIREQPFSVVLLDEVEKAHPNILNLLLQLLDEGQLTDSSGKTASFKDAIIIATSNAGAETIRQRIEAGESLDNFSKQFTDQLINSGQFKPELLNRFDEIVLFRPLKPEELAQVVQLMMAEVNKTLANQNVSVDLTTAAIQKIVEVGNDPRLGARPMRRTLQTAVEDTVAQRILASQIKPGDHVTLDLSDLNLQS